MKITINLVWHTDDIQMQARSAFNKELTDEQANEILSDLENNHNPEIGVNWDVIDSAIDDYLNTNKD